jgi:hypothetical protein
MKFEIGAMSVGDMLDRGIKMLWARLPTFYLINLIVLGPVLAFQLLMPMFLADEVFLPVVQQDPKRPLTPEQMRQLWDMLEWALGLLCFSLVGVLLQLILTFIGIAVSLHVIAGEFLDRHVGLGQAFRATFRRFWSFLGTMLLHALVLAVGFSLCCVPGFFFYTWFAFVAQVVVLERVVGLNAFSRSWQLTEGFRGRVFGMFMLLLAIRLGLLLFEFLFGSFFPTYDQIPVQGGVQMRLNYPNLVLGSAVSFLADALLLSYTSVCWTLFYFDLRIRKEGFDLEVLARRELGGQGAEAAEQPAPPEPLPDRPDEGQEWDRWSHDRTPPLT